MEKTEKMCDFAASLAATFAATDEYERLIAEGKTEEVASKKAGRLYDLAYLASRELNG